MRGQNLMRAIFSVVLIFIIGYGLSAKQVKLEIIFPQSDGGFSYGQTLLAKLAPDIPPPTHIVLEARPEGSRRWIPLITEDGDKFVSVDDPRIYFDAERRELKVKWIDEPKVAEDLVDKRCTLRLRFYSWPWQWAVATVENVILKITPPPPGVQMQIVAPEGEKLLLGEALVAKLTGLNGKGPLEVEVLVQPEGEAEWIPLVVHQGKRRFQIGVAGTEFRWLNEERSEGELRVAWNNPQVEIDGQLYSLKSGWYTVQLSVWLADGSRIDVKLRLWLEVKRPSVRVFREIALLPDPSDCSGMALIPQKEDQPFIVEVRLTLTLEDPDVSTILLIEEVPEQEGIKVGKVQVELNGLTAKRLRSSQNEMIWQLINISEEVSFVVVYEIEISSSAQPGDVQLDGRFQVWFTPGIIPNWENIQGINKFKLVNELPLLTAVANLGKSSDGRLYILSPRFPRSGESIENIPTKISMDQYWLALEAWQLSGGKIPYVKRPLTPEDLALIYTYALSEMDICSGEPFRSLSE